MKKYPCMIRNKISGFLHSNLTPEMASRLGYGIGTFFGQNTVFLIGRDFGNDSLALERSLTGGMLCSGIDIIDLGEIPTNVLQFMIRRFGADGGIMITHSHCLDGKLHLKIFNSTGIEVGSKDITKIIKLIEASYVYRVSTRKIGLLNPFNSSKIYKSALTSFFAKESELLKTYKIRVVVDCSNSPISTVLPDILDNLGFDIISLNSHRLSNPKILPDPVSLARLSKTVKVTDSDIGIAFDAEGKHPLFVDNQGQIHTPEETGAIIVKNFERPNHLATIVVTESVNPAIYEGLHYKIEITSPIESSCLPRKVVQTRAFYGLNDTGFFILPSFSPTSDGMLSSIILMTIMANNKESLHELYQKYTYNHQKAVSFVIEFNKIHDFFSYLMDKNFQGFFPIDTYCGVKLFRESDRSWLHFFLPRDVPALKIEIFNQKNNDNSLAKLSSFSKAIINNYNTNVEGIITEKSIPIEFFSKKKDSITNIS